MAARPNTAIAGRNPFPDLLFSSRPAFIWDETKKIVTWMNAAGKAAFGLCAKELQEALPARALSRFSQCFQERGKSGSTIRLKLAPGAALNCALEVIELAEGHRGLVVAEAAPQGPAENVSLPMPPAGPVTKHRGKAQLSMRGKKPGKRPAAIPPLTPEELRAFKATGRTVERLAAGKERASLPQRKPAPASLQKTLPSVQSAPSLLFSAFDLVLFLDRDFTITASEGRPQKLGWRKQSLAGTPAAQLFPSGEQAIFCRMVKKLAAGDTPICRETLAACGEAGGSAPCRVIIGRWEHGKARYFMALLSLSVPSRLKRLTPQAQHYPNVTKIAA